MSADSFGMIFKKNESGQSGMTEDLTYQVPDDETFDDDDDYGETKYVNDESPIKAKQKWVQSDVIN